VIQLRRREPLGCEDLTNLLAFTFWIDVNVFPFNVPRSRNAFSFRARSQIVADSHAEPVGKQVRCSEDDHDAACKTGSSNSRYHGERCNNTVLRI